MHRRLNADEVFRRCDPGAFPFADTRALEPLPELPGHARATEALRFGARIRSRGYNTYALGSPQVDMHDVVMRVIGAEAAARVAPQDCCYVNRFRGGGRPRALLLPSGEGSRLRDDMDAFAREIGPMLTGFVQEQDFRSRSQAITDQLQNAQRQALEKLQERAQGLGLAMLQTPQGFAFAPLHDGKVMEREAFEALPEEQRESIGRNIDAMNAGLIEALQAFPARHQEMLRAQKSLLREAAAQQVAVAVRPLRRRYQAYADVLAFLDDVEHDVTDNVEAIMELSAEGSQQNGQLRERFYGRYRVNLLVDNAAASGARVVYESNPTVDNLTGRIEHRSEMGNLVTDFSLIRAGALHRANGGYLLLDAERLFQRPFAWEALKRALLDERIQIESVGHMLSIGFTVTLDPDPVALRLKVVLLGSRLLYYMLCDFDPDFALLFKIAADFEDTLDRDAAADVTYARLIATLARQEQLLPLSCAAVARVIEHGSRLVADQDKLILHTRTITDLLVQSDHLAREAKAPLVDAGHIDAAIAGQVRRLDRLREDVHERIVDGLVRVETTGAVVGQVNGLAVLGIGDFSFGQPARITATVRAGRGEVVDIEREAKLGGNLHSKAMMIVAAFIGSRFGAHAALSLTASLVFEQSYGGIEGDSATLAEVAALLSALSGLPVRQSLAITGSMDQRGQAQAIGGVNEKIEGFHDICRARGFTGDQGVIVPAANVRHLMLRADVRASIVEGRFAVHSVDSIDDALSLLLGTDAGVVDADGNYPADSVNGLALASIRRFARFAREQREVAAREPNEPVAPAHHAAAAAPHAARGRAIAGRRED
jgi:predicted ATP-dependent protease